MRDRDSLISELKSYMLKEFLPGENPDELTEATPLVTGGILDSIATLKLVTHLEETYGISVEPHEVDAENLDNIGLICDLVSSKLGS